MTDTLPELVPGEMLLDDQAELLWRQVHPTNSVNGRPTSAAFLPNDADNGQLSCSREAKVTAEEAYVYHTETLGLESAGSWSITVGDANRVSLRCVDDSAVAQTGQPLPPGHAYVDYRTLSGNAIRKKARLLAHAAAPAYVPN